MMQFLNFNPDKRVEKVNELKRTIDTANEVEAMTKTPGWQHVERLLTEQLKAYQVDNAMNAKDWDDYLKKAGKIFGINLLLTDIEEFIRQGKTAEEEIDKLNR